jgi:glucan phosphoethanolaminetransferase (alkaline phosphatase superfamily)
LVLGIIAGILAILAAFLGFASGDTLTGIIAIVVFIIFLAFTVIAYAAKENTVKLVSSMLLMIFGFIGMFATFLISPFELLVKIVAIFAGLLAIFAAALLVPRKK